MSAASGSQSIRKVTRHAESPSGSNVTCPALGFSSGFPPTLSQEMRLSRICSVIWASHSRVWSLDLRDLVLDLGHPVDVAVVDLVDRRDPLHPLGEALELRPLVVRRGHVDVHVDGLFYSSHGGDLLIYSGIPERSRCGERRSQSVRSPMDAW